MNLFAPLTQQQATGQFDRTFQKRQLGSHVNPIQVRIFSERLDLDYSFPSDSTNQPYHIASIGKVFTATLVQMLAERGVLSIKDCVGKYLSQQELAGLFVYRNVDYAGQATIEHLLGHTSGVADYFEGKTKDKRSFADALLTDRQVHWTPQLLLDFTRANQAAVGVPGQVYNYSDTGYILLGLLIEKATGKSFSQNLEDEFFGPLGMNDSYLMFYSEPKNQPKKAIGEIWFNGVEVSGFESLSSDWAGGGIISTTDDLLKFNRALRGGRLVQASTLAAMDACTHKFRPGIWYGLGMMEIRFAEFFFLLGKLPKLRGHIGILATHMFYDPSTGAHIIMNFGSTGRMVESFQALIEIENIIQRIRLSQ